MLGVFLDQETTGLDAAKHCVIEVALKAYNLTTGEYLGEYQAVVNQSKEEWDQRDLTSIEINGFQWGELTQGKLPDVIGQEIQQFLSSIHFERGKAVFICQNPAFDRAFFAHLINVYTQEKLNWPYHWLDLASMFWIMKLQAFHQNQTPLPEEMNLSKDEIARHYGLPPEERPHRAMNGVDHLILCYHAVMGNGVKV